MIQGQLLKHQYNALNENMTQPEVSIVLVTYNRAERLKLAIQDILSQSYENFELIICDDRSPDNTQEICQYYAALDKRVRYIRNQTNLGMPDNLNQGIQVANCEYLAILHDADRYAPELIETWYNALSENSSVAFTFYRQALIDEDGQIIFSHRNVAKEGVVSGKHLLRKDFFRRWAFDSPIFGMSMVRRSLIENHGYFNPQYGFYADVDMWMTLLHDWDIFYTEKPLIKNYREEHQFDDNMWRIGAMMQKIFLKHRQIEFQDASFPRRRFELLLHYIYCYLVNLYRLLLTFKHQDRENLKVAKQFLAKDTPLLLFVWQMLYTLFFLKARLFKVF